MQHLASCQAAYDSQSINFSVTSGTICPTKPVIESSCLLTKHVVTGHSYSGFICLSCAVRPPPCHLTHTAPPGGISQQACSRRRGGGRHSPEGAGDSRLPGSHRGDSRQRHGATGAAFDRSLEKLHVSCSGGMLIS